MNNEGGALYAHINFNIRMGKEIGTDLPFIYTNVYLFLSFSVILYVHILSLFLYLFLFHSHTRTLNV